MKEERKSIIKEALIDMKDIQQAADANAKKRLAEDFPREFGNILKEELNKNKSAKESNVDSAETNKESDMKNLTKEPVKVVKETVGSGKPFAEKPKGVQKVAEDVKITDTVGKGDPFDEKAKGAKKIDEEREKDFMGDVESATPNQGKGEAEKGKIYNEKLVGPTSGKPIANTKKDVSENFNLSELDQTGANQSLDGAQPMDELLTMEQIEEEIANMGNMAEELQGVSAANVAPNQGGQEGGIAYNELVEMRDKLNKMIGEAGIGEQKQHGGLGANKVNPGGPTQPMIDEFGMEEQKNNGGQGANKVNAGGPTTAMIDELSEITEEDINAVLGANEAPVEESLTQTLGNMKKVPSSNIPGVPYKSTAAVNKMRSGLQTETEKKISSLIEENKKLTKKLNEAKKDKETKSKLVEGYQTVIGKYRSQLKEMAVFNTNLSHVNNLLVNEELALTQEDKVKIINEFKKVDGITSSVNVYKNLMTEMKVGKKTLTESFENKVSASIQPSSKQKLDEVKEKTAYTNVPRMKALIESMEKRGKKII
jgi:ribosomal protein S15P/S13E